MAVLPRLRKKLGDLAGSLDAAASRLAHLAITLFLWPVLYAATIGTSVFIARHTSWMALIDTNKVPAQDSYRMVFWPVGALLGYLLFQGLVLLVQRRRGYRGSKLALWTAVNHRLVPLLAAPLVPALLRNNLERDSPKETVFLVTLIGAAVGAGVYAWLRPISPEASDGLADAPPAPRPFRERLAKITAGLSVAALWAGYGTFFSWLSITNHRALNTRTTDLGYYDNIFWNSIHGHPLACSFIKMGYHGSAHFDPILVLLSPLYLLHPNAEGILTLQSVWLGMGVVPVYLLAQHKLGRRLPAVALAAMYAIYPALHGANMYEFHSLSLLSPVALCLLYFLEIGAFRRFFLVLIPTLLVREDVSLMMCFVGAYAILTGRPKMVRTGWVTIVVSLCYFVIIKRFFMTSADIFMSGSKDSYSFAYYYEDLIPNHNSMGGLVISLVTNPAFVLRTIIAEPKIHYMLVIFGPLLFLPFVAKTGRTMLIYGLIFCLLATRSAVFSPHFQYSSVLLPFAFALTPEALRQIEAGRLSSTLGLDGRRLSLALTAAAFVASLGISWKFGGIVDNQQFRGGFVRVARSLSDKERETITWVKEQTAKIPGKARVGTTNRIGAHVSNRRVAYFYPDHTDVDWLFIDEGELRGGDVDKHNKAVQAGTWVLISKKDKIALYQRAPKPAK